jgi:hypothetical protein
VRAKPTPAQQGQEPAAGGDGWSFRLVFSHVAAPLTAAWPPGVAGKDGGAFLTTPVGMAGAMRERVLRNEAIAVVRQRPRPSRIQPWTGGRVLRASRYERLCSSTTIWKLRTFPSGSRT